VGLTASAGLAGWLELALLRNGLKPRVGTTGLPVSFTGKLWIAAACAAAAGWGPKLMMHSNHPITRAIACLGVYGAVYFAMTAVLRVPEMGGLIKKVTGWARGG
jgi:putative peptidoglycan lipid II flippase